MQGPGQQLDMLFGALADPTRRLILDELRRRDGQSLFEICARLIDTRALSLSRQAISKHLLVLEDAGLITCARQGRTKLHSLAGGRRLREAGCWITHHQNKVGGLS